MRHQTAFLTVAFFISLAGCGSSQDSGSSFGGSGGSGGVILNGGGSAGADGGGTAGSGGTPSQPQGGLLTAGIWDDNLNFAEFESYRDSLWADDQSQVDERLFSDAEQEAANAEAQAESQLPTTLDVALVVDTTGSMGDEITYLQTEFRDLSAEINARYPDAQVRWSLVVYRDQGDEYVVRHDDFTDDPNAFRNSLAQQFATGGGDYPEAPERALELANTLAWRGSDATAKLAFWVADAPPHVQNLPAFADSVRDLGASRVSIYPVASSGVDESTEYFMRASAQRTGGRYIFITNDSGIGLDHKEPTISCYYVTLLRDAVLRAIDAEMLGEPAAPSEGEVIRSVGQPDASGLCQLEEGTAQAF